MSKSKKAKGHEHQMKKDIVPAGCNPPENAEELINLKENEQEENILKCSRCNKIIVENKYYICNEDSCKNLKFCKDCRGLGKIIHEHKLTKYIIPNEENDETENNKKTKREKLEELIDQKANYNIDDISKMIIKYNKSRNEMKYLCSSRKCFNINNISNIYLCNFHEKDKYYTSYPNEENNNRYPEINNYTEFCQNYTDFYYISKDKHKKYEFDYEFICPSKKDIIYNYALTYLFIFSNLFCTPILWFLEYYSFKILLSLLHFCLNI